MKRIYISGPITGTPNYRKKFDAAEVDLATKGYDVFNPAKINDALPPLLYDEFMQLDYEMLDMCDAIYMLNGWTSSKGAKLELQYALNKGIPVYTQAENVLPMIEDF